MFLFIGIVLDYSGFPSSAEDFQLKTEPPQTPSQPTMHPGEVVSQGNFQTVKPKQYVNVGTAKSPVYQNIIINSQQHAQHQSTPLLVTVPQQQVETQVPEQQTILHAVQQPQTQQASPGAGDSLRFVSGQFNNPKLYLTNRCYLKSIVFIMFVFIFNNLFRSLVI